MISTIRVRPERSIVAHTLTGPLGAVVGSRRAPAGNASTNISIP